MRKIKFSQIQMGAMISYIALAVNMLTGLIYTPWMVSKIGQSNYGIYALAISLISVFMLDFGLGSAVSRFVAKYRAEGNTDGVNNIMGIIYKLYMIIDLVIIAVLTVFFFFLDQVYVKLTPEELERFKVLYLMVAGFNIISFPCAPFTGILNAYEKFVQLKLCELATKLCTVASVIAVLSFRADVVSVVGANIVCELLGFLLKYLIIKKSVPVKANFKASGKELYKTLFGFTAWTTVISIMQRFTHSLAPTVLGMTSGSLEIAIHAPAVTLEQYFYTISNAVNGLFLPKVSRIIADKKEDTELLPLMVKVGRYQTALLGLIFIGFVSVGKQFMVLWMGEAYLKSYYCAVILMFPTFLSASQQIGHTTVIAKNLIKYKARCMIITGVAGLVLSYLLSFRLGAMGVCIGTAVTALANIVYMNIVFRKYAGIPMKSFYKQCYLKAIPCYGLGLLFGLVFSQVVPVAGWRGLLIKAFGVCVVYGALIWSIYLSRNERARVLSFIKRR